MSIQLPKCRFCVVYEHYDEHYTLVLVANEDSFSFKLMIFNDEWARPEGHELYWSRSMEAKLKQVFWLTNVYIVRTCDKPFNCLCSMYVCVCVWCVCTWSLLKSFHGVLKCPASSAPSLEHEIIAFMFIGLAYCQGKARILCFRFIIEYGSLRDFGPY
jgi:hypothetical protein